MINGQFTPEESAKLASLARDDRFKVALDALEFVCTESENEYIGLHPKDRELVLAQHSIMYAQRAMLERFLSLIDDANSEAMGEPKKQTKLTRQEVVDAILNARVGQ